MPYINQSKRKPIDPLIDELIKHIEVKGDLNYTFTRLVHIWIKKSGKNYQNLSDAKAALNDAADEFARLVLAPYEDEKRKQNGSVTNLESPYYNSNGDLSISDIDKCC